VPGESPCVGPGINDPACPLTLGHVALGHSPTRHERVCGSILSAYWRDADHGYRISAKRKYGWHKREPLSSNANSTRASKTHRLGKTVDDVRRNAVSGNFGERALKNFDNQWCNDGKINKVNSHLF